MAQKTLIFVVTIAMGLFQITTSGVVGSSRCRCFPGDTCWPTPADWAGLNSSIHGKLIATVPIGTPCHDPTYNAAQCKFVQDQWLEPDLHYETSSSVMAPFFTNQSCDPFVSKSSACKLGNYVKYAINVTERSDIAKGVAFATRFNIRLVIRNTGHDYNGKSTGAGSLAIWTHHLKNIEFIDYKDANYTGKAYKIGAGVQGIEAYEAASKLGLTVTSGECPTVGIAGGYTQGGGHSALASKYGLGADQVLVWEVITGTGKFLTATRTENTDLFWALSGGGGGTYGVVWSLTAKAHIDIPVSGANLSWTNEGISQETFFKSIAVFHKWVPSVVDAGAMSLSFGSNKTFVVGPITAPGVSAAKMTSLLQPLLFELSKLQVKHTPPVIRQYPGYLEQFKAMMPPLPVAVNQYGGWLIPRSVVHDNADGLAAAYANITNGGGGFTSVALNVNKTVTGDVYNAVNPAWRTALLDIIITTVYNNTAPLSDMVKLQETMTDKYVPQLKALAPDSGVYLNEGDWHDPDWAQTFYGKNYPRLKSIKKKYDPNDVFYATTAVGSDDWVIEAPGRLCRKDRTSSRVPPPEYLG